MGWSTLAERVSSVIGRAAGRAETGSKLIIRRAFARRGYQLQTLNTETADDGDEFMVSAKAIEQRHTIQDRELVDRLRVRHGAPVFGRVGMWDLLLMLGQCIDPSDSSLRCVSQLTHSLQVADSMHAAGIADSDLVVAALVHDLGKLLLLTGEDPANIVGTSHPIGRHPSGGGLDQCVMQWNHDQIIYLRLKDHVPDHLAWLLRYHSIDPVRCRRLMDGRDIDYTNRFLKPFMVHDTGSKSMSHIPVRPLDAYRDLIESYFPEPILF